MHTDTDKHFIYSCREDFRAGVCRSRGGESCAFDGAMIVLQCIADAAHLVHGPIACFGNSWESRGSVSDKGELHRIAYTTDLSELDIIHGAGEKLLRAIRDIFKKDKPRAVFVYSTCVTGLIGEDMDMVCRTAEKIARVPVIPVHAPGFVGPKNLGNRIAGEALLERVIGTCEPGLATPVDANLIGEYNIAGDLRFIEPLLERAGIRLLSRITGNSRFQEIACAHRAKLNVVSCSRALINVAQGMEDRYGIPYIEVAFFGKTQMAHALRSIAGMLLAHDADVLERVDRLIRDEEDRLMDGLRPYKHLKGKKAVLYTGGVKSWAFVSALMDLGIDVVAVGTKKATAQDEEKIKLLMGPGASLYEKISPSVIRNLMKVHDADILIAGGRNRYLAEKEGFPFVDVNQERHEAYAGYDGFINFARQIAAAIDFYRSGTTKAVASFKPVREGQGRSVIRNPLKHSRSIGAAMAMQGVDRAVAVLHGSQGCTFLGKVLLTRHFREPISMVSTKLFTEDVVMGIDERLEATIREFAEDHAPDMVAVLTTGLTEVQSGDMRFVERGISDLTVDVEFISTPDYEGGLEEGYASVVERLVRRAGSGKPVPGQVNVLAGPQLSPGDVSELRNILEDFHLNPVILPDLSALDGSRSGFSSLTEGGTRFAAIKQMGSSVMTLVIGSLLGDAAALLKNNSGVPYQVFDSLSGLGSSDLFISALSSLTGMEVPDRFTRQRKMLVDGMREAMTAFGRKRLLVAAETDASVAVTRIFREMGASVVQAVIPTEGPGANRIDADEVLVGDYSSLTERADLLVAGSHGELTAKHLGVPHLEWGFPVFERLGSNTDVSVGYRGTLNLINRAGNLINSFSA